MELPVRVSGKQIIQLHALPSSTLVYSTPVAHTILLGRLIIVRQTRALTLVVNQSMQIAQSASYQVEFAACVVGKKDSGD
ncbi:hypothetical protein MRB53_038545 [Persea americana]|nr:hypothetical protein MRB53_038545 [Persea americana]